MSLATRCTACGTVFRVVQDQLKVSGGWVRCGRCNEVFNAAEALVDADAGASAPDAHRQRVLKDLARLAAPAAAAAEEPAQAWGKAAAPVDALPTPESESESVSESMPAPAPASAPEFEPRPAPALQDETAARTSPLDSHRNEPTWPPTPASASAALESIDATDGPPAPPAADDLRADVRPERVAALPRPGFVRAAERAARWQQPRMRAVLLLVALAAAALLAFQAALAFRDRLAASWPASRVLLEPACRIAGCRVEPLRRIDGLAVRSSSLVRVEGTALMRLTVVLHNRDRVELMLPALELVLSDAQGRALVRRVLRPAELGAQRETLAAGAELPLAATLGTGDQAVVGYTIEIFYP